MNHIRVARHSEPFHLPTGWCLNRICVIKFSIGPKLGLREWIEKLEVPVWESLVVWRESGVVLQSILLRGVRNKERVVGFSVNSEHLGIHPMRRSGHWILLIIRVKINSSSQEWATPSEINRAVPFHRFLFSKTRLFWRSCVSYRTEQEIPVTLNISWVSSYKCSGWLSWSY